MSTLYQTTLAAGFIILGCLLPWQNSGGILGMKRPGLEIAFADGQFWFYDHGGTVIIGLAVLVLAAAWLSHRLRAVDRRMALLSSVGVVALSLYHAARILTARHMTSQTVEPSSPQFGLVVLVVSAVWLLIAARLHFEAGASISPDVMGER